MEGIMKPVTEELEPEDSFEDLVADNLVTLRSKAFSFFYGANSWRGTACDICIIFELFSESVTRNFVRNDIKSVENKTLTPSLRGRSHFSRVPSSSREIALLLSLYAERVLLANSTPKTK